MTIKGELSLDLKLNFLSKIENDKSDRRLNYQRNLTEICAYAEEYFRFNPKKPAVKKGSE